MARTRIKGKNLTITVNGEEFQCDLTSAVLQKDSAESGQEDTVQTFCEAGTSAAGQVWYMDTTAIQSTDTATNDDGQSLWRLVWDSASTQGGAELPFVFAPYSNETPSADQPHFTGTLIVDEGAYPAIGGDAGVSTFTWTYRFLVKDNLVNMQTAANFAAKATTSK